MFGVDAQSDGEGVTKAESETDLIEPLKVKRSRTGSSQFCASQTVDCTASFGSCDGLSRIRGDCQANE